MARRALPFRPKLPESAADLLSEARTATFYLVQRPGPLSFVLRAEGSDVKHRVLIGPYQQCSCGGGNTEDYVNQDTENELCVHILFVMTRVLGVPARSPLVWQLSLVDREVEEVLKYRFPSTVRLSRFEPTVVPRKKPFRKRTDEIVQRRLQEDAICAICCERMTMEKEDLVFCRFGCGNSVHGPCIKVWAEHQRSIRKELTCPLCRKEWGPLSWGKRTCCETVWQSQAGGNQHNATCSSCGVGPMPWPRFRCTCCERMNLCGRCFEAGVHPEHPFVMRRTSAGEERRAPRPSSIVRIPSSRGSPRAPSLIPATSELGPSRDGNAQQSDMTAYASLLLHRRTSSGGAQEEAMSTTETLNSAVRSESVRPQQSSTAHAHEANSDRHSPSGRGRRVFFQYLKNVFRFRRLRWGGIISRNQNHARAENLQRG